MYEFKLPEIGEGVVEGEIVRWLRQVGESVQANQGLLEVMTDKATVEVPSPIHGIIRDRKVEEGEICPIGGLLCRIEQSGSGAAPQAPAKATSPAPAPSAASQAPASQVLATPAARHLARENNIDLHALATDERGRVTKRDVLAAQANGAIATKPAAAAPQVSTPPLASKPSTSSATSQPEYIPFRGMRRIIAEGMVRSNTTAVHYTYVERIDVTALVKLRDKARKSAAEVGVSLSYLPFIVKAVCHALKKYPIVNAELDEANARIVLKKDYHVGVAAATAQGLTVPVIRHADRLSLLDIAREITRLSEGARNGKLSREELSGSTFTITSLGTIGGLLATPILNYPEVGILGVHAIRKEPIVDENDEIVVGHIMNLSSSFDHRIVDGFEGASFLQEVKRYLEDPTLLLLAGI
jgi:pyruvate dehydrogenase E2 component (dihydrolipoamide acetyltransferase)